MVWKHVLGLQHPTIGGFYQRIEHTQPLRTFPNLILNVAQQMSPKYYKVSNLQIP